MPALIVHQRARADVEDHAIFICRDKMDAALRFMAAAEKDFETLAVHPGLGPVWDPVLRDHPGLRFWPVSGFRNYLILYKLTQHGVEIGRVIHGARDVTRVMGPAL